MDFYTSDEERDEVWFAGAVASVRRHPDRLCILRDQGRGLNHELIIANESMQWNPYPDTRWRYHRYIKLRPKYGERR